MAITNDNTELVRYRLNLAYDGTKFKGWAKQPGLRTVESTLENALAKLFHRSGASPRLIVAGRTDAGVHATGQVVHFDLAPEATVPQPEFLVRRLNGILGAHSDLVVYSAENVPQGFDARFSAVWRRYEYRIADREALHNPLEHHRTVWYPQALTVDLMKGAAESVLGLHDFAAFCKPRKGATTIRTLHDFRWQRNNDGVLMGFIQADAFCHNMVRSLVGACVAVGEGKLHPDRIATLRDVGERGNAFTVMPAHGLTLVEVGYPPDEELGRRAQQTRALRGFPHEPGITALHRR